MRTTVGIQKLILCAGVALGVSLAAAIAVWHGMIGSRDQRSANLTGVVQIGADGDMCQRFVIDHKTGFIKQEQRVACRETAKESGREAPKDSRRETAKGPGRDTTKQPISVPERAEPRYSSGARIEAVRDSFNNR